MGIVMDVRNDKGGIESSANVEAPADKKTNRIGKLATATHLFKGNVGAGIFAMGDGFKNGGLLGATVLIPIIAIICVHCEQLLIASSLYVVEKNPGIEFYDYPDTVEKVFQSGPIPMRKMSKIMRTAVEIFLCVTQFGFCAIYFVFIVENIHQVLVQNGIEISETVAMIIALVPAMIPSLFTNIKYISPVSMLANVSLIFGLFATLTIALQSKLPSLSERHLTTNGRQMALFFGTALFSYEGIALVLPLRNKMKKPENFTKLFGVLNMTMAFVTALFIFSGFIGYLRWGENVEGSITLNLDPNDIFSQVVKVVAAMGVFFGYPIQFFILIEIIWVPLKETYDVTKKYPITMEVILRFLMTLCTFAAAAAVPRLSIFISLLGALCSTALALLIPVLLDFTLRAGRPKGLTTWIYMKNIAIIGIAVVGILTGTYQSIVDIINAFFV